MSKSLTIYLSLMSFLVVNSQMVQHACRFRNFSVASETNSAYLFNFTIYQDKLDHKAAITVNITKDVRIKSIEVLVDRCSYEKSSCEYFQRWKFTENLKAVVYMNNQMWTPIFDHITPPLEIPHVKKNIYYTPDAIFNTKAIVQFYPEVVNYFWRADAILNDYSNKKPIVLKFEFSVHSFGERSKKRNPNRETTKNT